MPFLKLATCGRQMVWWFPHSFDFPVAKFHDSLTTDRELGSFKY